MECHSYPSVTMSINYSTSCVQFTIDTSNIQCMQLATNCKTQFFDSVQCLLKFAAVDRQQSVAH